jgi:dihydrodipicolinate synthase/N-acetylneuraminate lyase
MSELTNELFGVVPIVPTPFTENEEIDENALRNLIDFAIAGGIKAVCLPAYASEFYKLTDEEKLQVVRVAVEHAAGRIKIVAQSNHPSLKVAIRLAQANVAAGADVVSLAVPRIFSLPESSLKQYLSEFLQSIPTTPVLIQDFNPGGSSISVEFIKELMDENPNFKYLKLEEPLCAPKFESIIKATKGKVGLFEGWGGLYMLELVPIGIQGVMPGLAVADILQRVFDLRRNGEDGKAFDLFEKVMPQIFFSLQNMELFHYAEKELLIARGVLSNSIARKAAYIPDASSVSYIKELNQRVIDVLNDETYAIRPVAEAV